MPTNIDILLERLKHFDEVTLLELLDINAEDILERFKDKVIERKSSLFGEVEILNIDDEYEEEDEYDGFQIIHPEDYDEDFRPSYNDNDDDWED